MKTGLIVAMTPSGLIGWNGGMPWRYKADFQRFKTVTMGGVLIMGSKTYKSLPKPTLPGRVIIVLTRQAVASGELVDPQTGEVLVHRAWDLNEAMKQARTLNKPIWVAGGGQIYRQALEQKLVDFADVTLVPDVSFTADEIAAAYHTFPRIFLHHGPWCKKRRTQTSLFSHTESMSQRETV